MKKLSIVLFLVFFGMLWQSCNDDVKLEEDSNKGINTRTAPNTVEASNILLIQEVQDSLNTGFWSELVANVGTPIWDCVKISKDEGVDKIVVPFINDAANDIDHLFIGYKSSIGDWRVGVINKYYYQLLMNTTSSYANFLFCNGMLSEFNSIEQYCDQYSSATFAEDYIISSRQKEVVASITFSDGTVWQIWSDGSITISPGGGSSCVDGQSGTIFWMDGRIFSFPEDNGSSTEGANIPDGSPFKWDTDNTDFTCSWCTGREGGSGGGRSYSGPLCKSSAFWSGSDPQVKKDYIKAISDYAVANDINICHTPPPLENMPEGCDITFEDILCGAYAFGCFSEGGMTYNGFTECFTSLLPSATGEPTPTLTPLSTECKKMAFEFLFEHDVDLTISEILNIASGLEDCSSKEKLEEAVLEYYENQNFTVVIENNSEILDLVQSIIDCFGSPDDDGNYIDCTNNNSTFNFTIYVDQPNPGTRDTYSGSIFNSDDIEVGHTFVSFTENSGSGSSTLVFGLYPLGGADPLNPETTRAIVDDGGHSFEVSLSFDLTCSDFNQLLQQAVGIQGDNYNLNDNNCTDFGLNLGNSIDCCIPDSQGSWGVGSGSNPGDLGEDLRNYNTFSSSVNTTPGNAPFSNCD